MTLTPRAAVPQVAWRFGMCALLLLSCSDAVHAQPLRDPTVAPASAGLPDDGVARREPTLQPGHVSVLTRNGVHYLMHATRLYAVGQAIGQARVERITETEVWLREGGRLQKIQVFDGVQRRAASPAAPKKPSVAPVMVRPAKNTP